MRLFLVALAFLPFLVHPASASGSSQSPEYGSKYVVFRTDLGDFIVATYPKEAPKTVAQFVKLARAGVYDSVRFYRVIPNYIVQLAAAYDRALPFTQEQRSLIHPIPLEAGAKHVFGVLSMAHGDANPNDGETSFSILLANAPHLDGKYTVFGQVVAGFGVLRAFLNARRNSEGVLSDDYRINRAEVVSARDLATVVLKPAPMLISQPSGADTSNGPVGPAIARPLVILVLLMMGIGMLIFLLARRLGPRTASTLGLAIVLIGAFGLMLVAFPLARQDWRTAIATFVGVVGLFKLMNQFELPEKQR